MLKYIRVVLVSGWFFGALGIVTVISIFRPFNPDNAYFFCKIGPRVCVRLMGVKLIKKNLDRLNEAQPCIYIANHQNLLDVIFLASIFPRRALTIGKRALRWIPLFGWTYWLSGHLLIKRENFKKAMGTMLEAKKALLNEKLSIWLFPEGTRSENRGLLPFKKGAFHLAIETKAPLQPIVASPYVGKLKLNKWRSGTVVIEALPLIEVAHRTKNDVDALIAEAQLAFKVALDNTQPKMV